MNLTTATAPHLDSTPRPSGGALDHRFSIRVEPTPPLRDVAIVANLGAGHLPVREVARHLSFKGLGIGQLTPCLVKECQDLVVGHRLFPLAEICSDGTTRL